MNPFVIPLGGSDALLARETFLTCIYIYIYIFFFLAEMVCCLSLACGAYNQKRNIRQYRNDRVLLFTIFINLFTPVNYKLQSKWHSDESNSFRCRGTQKSIFRL